jgi:hypothetical protein
LAGGVRTGLALGAQDGGFHLHHVMTASCNWLCGIRTHRTATRKLFCEAMKVNDTGQPTCARITGVAGRVCLAAYSVGDRLGVGLRPAAVASSGVIRQSADGTAW